MLKVLFELYWRRRGKMNNNSRQSFRDQLLEREQLNPIYKEKYEKEVKAMTEKKLTGIMKLSTIVSLIMGLGFTILFGVLAVIVPKELPMLARLGFVIGAIFGLVWAIISIRILKKGVLNLKTDSKAMAGMTWVFVVIMMTLFLMLGGRDPNSVKSVFMVLYGMVFLISAASYMINTAIEQARLSTHEKLLKIEYRLAELAEQLTKK